jgi:hypothetical protein
MHPPTGLLTKDYVTWFFTIVALAWNAYNFCYARKIRRDAFELDEWKLERGEVLRTIRDFEDEMSLLLSLSNGAHEIEPLREQITEANMKIALAHRKLVREIERSNILKVAPSLAYGVTFEGESAWDRINEALGEVALIDDPNHVRSRLSRIVAISQTIVSGIEGALNAQRIHYSTTK